VIWLAMPTSAASRLRARTRALELPPDFRLRPGEEIWAMSKGGYYYHKIVISGFRIFTWGSKLADLGEGALAAVRQEMKQNYDKPHG
jgi:hypothetical protein